MIKSEFETMFNKVFILIAACVIGGGQGANCPNGAPILKSGLSESDKLAVINAHNQVRLDIANGRVSGQPRGTNLKRMVWDDALAQEAKSVSNTCKMNHITATDPRWSWVGQNLYNSFTSSSSDNGAQDWNKAVQSWFSEHTAFTYPNQSNGVTGHYTQVVWATSTHVGCDFVYFKDPATNMYSKLYTCNYGPGGNYNGQAPYQTGSSGCENLC